MRRLERARIFCYFLTAILISHLKRKHYVIAPKIYRTVIILSIKIHYLLIFVPIAILFWALAFGPELVFIFSFIGLMPLAALLAESTEVLACETGPKIGALLNASFGSAVDLILLLALLRSGQLEIVKASLIGSILTTLLLVVGLSQLMGGLKNGIQRFDREGGGMAAAMMTLAVIAMILPSILGIVHQLGQGLLIGSKFQDPALDLLSLLIAVVLLGLYGFQIVFQFRQPQCLENREVAEIEAMEETNSNEIPQWGRHLTIGILLAATIGVAIMSEIISTVVEPFGQSLGLSPLFIGIVIIPLAAAVPEIIVGVRTARRNKLDLSLSIASNSVMQIALFVAPLLVFLSLAFGQELTLYFNIFEMFALVLAVFAAIIIAIDGVSNWMEGAQFLALYLIIALWFYFIVPASWYSHL
jgi:Ca2+:H+ antiporter